MSAWVVEREHVDVMIRFGLSDIGHGLLSWRGTDGEWRKLDHANTTEVGRMLMEENVASVCARYEDDTADTYEDELAYEYRDPRYEMTPQEALKAIGCFEYQACEHDEWESSEAFRFCESLKEYAIGKLYAGPWGWDGDALKAAKINDSAEAL